MRRNIALLALLLTCGLVTACGGGGGGSPSVPSSPSQGGSGMGTMSFRLKIPSLTSQARARLPENLTRLNASPAVKGVGMSIVAQGATAPSANTPQLAFDLSTCSTTGTVTCIANADGSHSYSVSSPLIAFGSYTVVISTWDSAPSSNTFSGNELSEGSASVVVSASNATVNVTLNGIPASLVMTQMGAQTHVMSVSRTAKVAIPLPTPFHPIGNTPTQWIVTALDADGYIIAGSGTPNIKITDSTNSVSVTQSGTQSNVYTMKVLQAQPSPVFLTATATYSTQAASNKTVVATFRVQPIEELWTTTTGVGIAGYPLDPANQSSPYSPIAGGCCGTNYEQTDGVASTDALGALAQDSNGNIWVVDTTTNVIQQYSVGTGTTGMSKTNVTIPLKGLTIAGLAGDANGFLYGIDTFSSSLEVWNASTQALTWSVPISDAASPGPGNPLGVSVIPTGKGVASGIAGTVMVADINGVDFYSNAKNGKPSFLNNATDTYLSGGAYGASVATDTGTLWMMEGSGGSTTIGTYSLSSSLIANPTGASAPSATDEIGYFSAGVNNYGWTSSGTDAWAFYQYQFDPVGVTMSQPTSFPTGASNYTWGVLVVP